MDLDIEVTKGTTKGHEAIAKKFMSSLEKHLRWMDLNKWIIKVEYVEIDEDCGMETSCQPQYYKATIGVDLAFLDSSNKQREAIDEYVRHELLHVVLWIYTALAEDLSLKKGKGAIRKMEERVVSDLERMPLWDKLYKNS